MAQDDVGGAEIIAASYSEGHVSIRSGRSSLLLRFEQGAADAVLFIEDTGDLSDREGMRPAEADISLSPESLRKLREAIDEHLARFEEGGQP